MPLYGIPRSLHPLSPVHYPTDMRSLSPAEILVSSIPAQSPIRWLSSADVTAKIARLREMLGTDGPCRAYPVRIGSKLFRTSFSSCADFWSRLRCDRAVPACGNCVNRGDITACGYLSRRPEPRPNSQELPNLSDSAQARIDHLEQLVLTLLKNSRSAQNQLHTPSTSVDADPDGNLGEAGADHHERDEHGNTDKQTPPILAKPGTVSSINFDLKERLSVNEAHWALLLNEVRNTSTFRF